MSSSHDYPIAHTPAAPPHPLPTIRDIRASLEGNAIQLAHFDAELAVADVDELPTTLHRWATFGHDGFEEFLFSTPFEGLEFGARSYDEAMSSTHGHPDTHTPATPPRPLRTICDIRASLEDDEVQLAYFDAELAVTDVDELASMLHRWATLGHDGFKEFLKSRPFEGLEFGARSYDLP